MFPTRYFCPSYYGAHYWAKIGKDAPIPLTPKVWFLQTRDRGWSIEMDVVWNTEEKSKVWEIASNVDEDNGDFILSWNLPERIKTWTLS